MRKHIIAPAPGETTPSVSQWLNLEQIAEVEITSEDPASPVEAALLSGACSGWRAAGPGRQTIRLLFTVPQSLRLIRLRFIESEVERTQEYVLRWSTDGGRTYREITRQQWNFSPGYATCETEDHQVELSEVSVLELSIIPDISGGEAIASLARLQLA